MGSGASKPSQEQLEGVHVVIIGNIMRQTMIRAVIISPRLWICRPPAGSRAQDCWGEVHCDRAQGVFPPLRGGSQSRGLSRLGGQDGDTSQRSIRLQLPAGASGEAGLGGEDRQPGGRAEHLLLSLCHLGGQSGTKPGQEIITSRTLFY